MDGTTFAQIGWSAIITGALLSMPLVALYRRVRITKDDVIGFIVLCVVGGSFALAAWFPIMWFLLAGGLLISGIAFTIHGIFIGARRHAEASEDDPYHLPEYQDS